MITEIGIDLTCIMCSIVFRSEQSIWNVSILKHSILLDDTGSGFVIGAEKVMNNG